MSSRIASGNQYHKDIMQGGLASLAIKVMHAFLAFFVAVTLARLLGPEDYGIYSFALAVLMLVALPSQVGLPQLVVRETARAQSDSDWDLIKGLWKWVNRVAIVTSGVALVAVLIALLFAEPSPRSKTIAVGVALIPLIALGNIRAACLRGLQRVVLGQLPESLVRPLIMLTILIGTMMLGVLLEPHGPLFAMSIYAISSAIAFAIGMLLLRRNTPHQVRYSPTARAIPNQWRRAVIPLATIAGLQLINSQADLVVLGMFRSNEEVGIYRAVTQMALLIVFGLQAMNQMLEPHFARLYRQEDIRNLQKLVTISTYLILALALPIALILVFFGSELLAWTFGNSFRSGAAALAVLAIGQGIKAAAGTSLSLLNMTGFEKVAMRLSVFAVSINLVGNLALVPLFGTLGAATATTISSSVWFLAMSRMTMRHCQVQTLAFSTLVGTIKARSRGQL